MTTPLPDSIGSALGRLTAFNDRLLNNLTTIAAASEVEYLGLPTRRHLMAASESLREILGCSLQQEFQRGIVHGRVLALVELRTIAPYIESTHAAIAMADRSPDEAIEFIASHVTVKLRYTDTVGTEHLTNLPDSSPSDRPAPRLFADGQRSGYANTIREANVFLLAALEVHVDGDPAQVGVDQAGELLAFFESHGITP